MAKRVDAAKRDDWRGRLAKFDSSGLTVAEFCRRENVSEARFYYWSKRIRRPDQPSGPRPVTSRADDQNESVEVLVGDSIRVRMPSDEPAAVADLIRHLQAATHGVGKSAASSRFQRIELTHRSATQR